MSAIPPYAGSSSPNPQSGQSGWPARHPSQPAQPSKGGFFKDLFDFTFTQFITVRALAVLWGVIVGLTVIGTLASIVLAFVNFDGVLIGLGTLAFMPLLSLLHLIIWRIVLEFLAVQFRQADLLAQVAARS